MKTSKKETRREVRVFRRQVKEEIGRSKEQDYANRYPECEPVADFIEGLSQHLIEQTGKYIKKYGKDVKVGFGEAVIIGIAKFVCVFLERMQDNGFVRDGIDGYTLFVEGILPSAHELVLNEKREQASTDDKVNKMAEMLADESIPLEEVYNRFFSKDESAEQKEDRMQKLAEVRELILIKKKS